MFMDMLGDRACPMSHISPQENKREIKTFVRTAGKVVELATAGGSQVGGGLRGKIEAWSRQSRSRLVKTAEAIEWEALGDLLFVTLTYRECPGSGSEVKRHLDNFRKRMVRKFGALQGMWKLEFQRRGVPHYHLLLVKPPGHELPGLRQWFARAWYEVVGTGDEAHLRAGTEVDYWRSRHSPGGYFAKYGSKRGKEYQNQAPEGFEPGRWWGAWGLRPDWVECELKEDAWWRVRRAVLTLIKKRSGRYRRFRRAYEGVWIRGGDRSHGLAVQLARLVAMESSRLSTAGT